MIQKPIYTDKPFQVVLVHPKQTGARWLGKLISVGGALFLRTWVVMLTLGVAHEVWPAVPPLGYWTVLVLLVGISFVSDSARYLDPRWQDQ